MVRTLAASQPESPADGPAATPIGHFEHVAARHAGRLAVATDRGERTYGQINSAANRLAHHILRRGGTAGDRVAVFLAPGPEIYEAMVGTLKAARIVVFLDPTDPPGRLRQIVSDAEPALILTDALHRTAAAEIAGRAAITVLGEEAGESADNPGIDIDPDEIAFLVHTSGSTGRPKAVMKSHGHVLLQPLTAGREIHVTTDDRILMLAPLGGGQGINTAWVALANGASLIAFPTAEKGVTGLGEVIEARRVSVMIAPPSLFRTLMRTLPTARTFPGIRLVTLAGEAATWRDFEAFRDHFPNGTMVTAFAASETGYIALNQLPHCPDVGTGPLPVGRPCAERHVRIIDPDGNTCPPGVIGKVEVSGPHLASGYWRDPELTAQMLPIGPDGARVFRSSDLGAVAADGSLILAGRADDVIKVRGHRVDLSEVEAALSDLPCVAAAAATANSDQNGRRQLVGYLVLDGSTDVSERRIRTVARAAIPRHLIPSTFVLLDALPRTANGKVDRAKLSPPAPRSVDRPHEAPGTETERRLIAIWEDAFGRDGIAPSDNFFDLGGDSLIATEIGAAVHAAFGVSIMDTILDAPSLKTLAAEIDRRRRRGPDDPGPVPVPRDRPVPLSFEQLAMWQRSHDREGSSLHTIGTATQLNGPLQVSALRRALDYAVARHEALRTRFAPGEDEPTQIVEPPKPVDLPVIDLSETADQDAAVRNLLQREQKRWFDLSAAPPLAFALVRLAPERHMLVESHHHIISDARSWGVFTEDLGTAYAALVAGQDPSLPPLQLQYADYAIWQRRLWRPDSPRHRDMIAWWRAQFAQAASWHKRMWLRQFIRRGPTSSEHDHFVRWRLDSGTAQRLDELARSERATYFTVRLASLTAVLAALTGTETVVIGAAVASRKRPELGGIFGPFVALVPLILRCERDVDFRESVRRLRKRLAEIEAHADARLVDADTAISDGLEMPPLYFRVRTTVHAPSMNFAGVEFRQHTSYAPPRQVGIGFVLNEAGEQDGGNLVNFDPRLHDRSLMADLVGRIARFTDTVSRQPDASIQRSIDQSGVTRDLPGRRSANVGPA